MQLERHMATKLTATKHRSYTLCEKLRIIEFGKQNGNRAADCQFGVCASNITKKNLQKLPQLKRVIQGKKPASPE